MQPVSSGNPIQLLLNELKAGPLTHKALTSKINEITAFLKTAPYSPTTNGLLDQITKQLKNTGYNVEARTIAKLAADNIPELPAETWYRIFKDTELTTLMQEERINKQLDQTKEDVLIRKLRKGDLALKDFCLSPRSFRRFARKIWGLSSIHRFFRDG